MKRNSKQAFSILEMAIVVTIIGLIVGSVVGGKRMLQQSRLQAVISDLTKVKSAVDQFKLTYGGLPGDIVEAASQWGTDTGNCSIANRPIGTAKTLTCDGNSDGLITGAEQFRAWQQLAAAGLWNGSYTGIGNSDDLTCIAGTNCPNGKLENSAMSLFSIGTILSPASGTWWPGNYGTVVMIGQTRSAFNALSPILSPKDAESIDKKIDDAKPATGKVFVARSIAGMMAANGCVTDITGTSAATLTTNYVRRSNVANSCNLGMKID